MDSAHWRSRSIDAFVVLFVAGIIAGAAWLHWRSVLGRDVAHFLALAKIVAQGRTLYSDVIDENFPGMVGLGLSGLAIERRTGIALDRSFVMVVILLISIALGLAWRLVGRLQGATTTATRTFAVATAITLFVLPGFDFATREHLFFASFLPYAAAVAVHHAGVRRSMVFSTGVALLAAFGLFLKPQFLLFLGVTSVYEITRTRGRLADVAVETWLTWAMLAAAFAAFLIGEPAYLQRIIPFTIATYGQEQVGWWTAIVRNWFPVALAAAVMTAATALSWRNADSPVRALLPLGWLYWLAGVMLVGVQAMGFTYHALPLRWMGLLTGSVLCVAGPWTTAGRGVLASRPRRLRYLCAAAASMLMTVVVAREVNNSRFIPPRSAYINHPFTRMMNSISPTDSAVILCGSVVPAAWAILYSDARWAGHMIPLYFLAVVADYRSSPRSYPGVNPSALAEVEQYDRQRITEDFEKRRPGLVLIDVGRNKRYMKTEGFEYLPFLEEEPRFTAAWERLHYQRVGSVIDFSGRPFAIYRRAE